ncbi:GTP-binding protein [Leptolyngbya sp. 'hensonii']|uniref:YcjF family protein n=1 Tax=Leptolyngbya sp. 'hensonii' TaxID=1922337 RepID=UPI000950265B|nr:GTP-binding protein [Leptolyngbya sp. 'hensonii']OLP17719.1 GTP-binding protein [Leptolyngbya sp. 'hensonii']
MPLPRLLILLVGLGIILGLLIWLISSLAQLYTTIALTQPLLGNLLLIVVIALLLVLVGAFLYYFLILPQGRKKSRRQQATPKVSEVRTEAAEETLKAVRRQVAQIQDEVARQELLSRSREIEQNLNRGEIRVVVFGTGSAGKTSLVNALLGRIVGRVDAPMGSTTVSETYLLRFKGVDRQILITDTPGILEVGVAGTEREQLARQLATDANLLLFVVDNDLRQSEYEPLKALVEIGKRSVLVFNKTDLYPDVDRETLLARLRERVRGVIPAQDVVAIAANPQPVRLETGELVQPEPDVLPLLRRMAIILRSEGEDLVADNILLQSQRLGAAARRLIDGQRRRQADKVVDRFQWIGAGVIAVTPLPVVDMLAAAAVNAQMVVEIGKVYGCEINLERGREMALSLAKTLVGLGVVKGTFELLQVALNLNLGTLIVSRVIQAVSAAYLTRIAGKSFIEYFRHNQDWGDGGITEVVQRQFELNRRDEFIGAFIQEAIARVVRPLTGEVRFPSPIEEEIEP